MICKKGGGGKTWLTFFAFQYLRGVRALEMSEVIRFYDNNIGLVPKFPLFGLFKFCEGGGGQSSSGHAPEDHIFSNFKNVPNTHQ